MGVVLVGSNPGLLLMDPDSEERIAYASVWRVDWSIEGPGMSIVVWQPGRTRVLTTREALGRWLIHTFNHHFPEVRDLEWSQAEMVVGDVHIDGDMSRGVSARAGGVEVEIESPLTRKLIQVESFQLGDSSMALSTVISPCAEGRLTIDGESVRGVPKVVPGPYPSSSAFLADAEVWSEL